MLDKINTTGEGGVRYKNVIDLSSDNELSKRVGDLHGSSKYKVIQQYILDVLADQPIVLSDGKKAIVDRSDALHIANKSGSKKTAQISSVKKIVETAVLYGKTIMQYTISSINYGTTRRLFGSMVKNFRCL